MKFIKKIFANLCRWLSGPEMDQERFEDLENKKPRRKNDFNC